MSKNNDNDTDRIETIIGAGSTIHGDIVTKNSLIVNGVVTGDVKTSQTIRLGASGAIRGNVKAKAAIVGGIIEGDLEAVVSTVLGPNSQLLGDLRTASLTIEEGATFEGRCVMLKGEVDTDRDTKEKTQETPVLRIT